MDLVPRQRRATNNNMNTDNERRYHIGQHRGPRHTSRSSSSNNNNRLYERYNDNVNNNKTSSRHQQQRSNRGRHTRRDYDANSSVVSDDGTIIDRDRLTQRLKLVALALVLYTIYTRLSPTTEKIETISIRSEYINDPVSNKHQQEEITSLKRFSDHFAKKQLQQDLLESIQKQADEQQNKLSSSLRKKRWNPCLNSKRYELERHDHEARHGDVCRAKGGGLGIYECPGKSAFVLFYHMTVCVQYEVSAIWILHLNFVAI